MSAGQASSNILIVKKSQGAKTEQQSIRPNLLEDFLFSNFFPVTSSAWRNQKTERDKSSDTNLQRSSRSSWGGSPFLCGAPLEDRWRPDMAFGFWTQREKKEENPKYSYSAEELFHFVTLCFRLDRRSSGGIEHTGGAAISVHRFSRLMDQASLHYNS